MKHKLLSSFALSLFLLLSGHAIAQELNSKTVDKQGREKLLGKIDLNGLTSDSFKQWFEPQYENYQVDSKTITAIKEKLKEYTIMAFLGTWCGDSRREIPRFYKILKAIDFPKDQLTIIAVDNQQPNYKKSPGGEEKGLGIIKVPTFIFYKDGSEVNRIIEAPVVSLEKDIEAIVTDKEYLPNYSNLQKN